VKPVAIARRGGKSKGARKSPEQKNPEATAEQEQARLPSEPEAAPPAPKEAPVRPSAPPPLAEAVFESSPPAQIRVNGQFVGLSPVTLRNLAPGLVQVEVYDSVKGFTKRRTFVLGPGDNGVLRVEVKQAALELRVRPKTAVFLDGKYLGLTPLEPIHLYEGKHGLRLESEELSKQIITTLTLQPGEHRVFEFDMEKDP
jgi:serine/threonine-protein kinase